MREIELLAPARDMATGIEAIRHGADAVYIGAPKFGARAAAGNSVEDIRQLVEYAHPFGVKVYVTLNTIIYDNELDEVQCLVGELANAGVDALIVQDFAICAMTNGKWLKANEQDGNQDFSLSTLTLRQLRLHASTQMDNRTAEKVAWLRYLGFEQVVLARELTLDEIRDIHQQVPDVRLEVFVHGAICVSYNGQCYASQYCFGRSANRGECAQFCRMPFDLIEEQGAGGKEQVLLKQKHLLSLRDMNRSNELEALLDAGASSLKIEGRLKDPAYVKNVVAYYRQQLDEIFSRRHEYKRSSLGHEVITFTPNPAKSFNRLFTNYFMHGRTPDMANIYTPKSMGEPIGFAEMKDALGDVRRRLRSEEEQEGLRIKDSLTYHPSPLHNGDGLCFINEEGQLEGFRVNRVEDNIIYSITSNGNPSPLTLHPSSLLYRNHDQQFEQQLSKPTATRKVGISWLLKEVESGFLLRLTREDGAQVEQTFTYPHELARSPQTESITRQLSRLGDTPYEATNVGIQMSQNWFIPNSVLAEWRRKALLIPPLKGWKKNEHQENAPLPSREGWGKSISYLGNVANHVARQIYLDQGAKQVDWAMEVATPKMEDKGLLIMTCRYCIRYELGMCKRMKYEEQSNRTAEGLRLARPRMKDEGELFLRLADGRRFRLHFDCKQCQMLVYATKD